MDIRSPIVSIIIPCRNEEKYIGTCLKSIAANDYPKDRLEVLVVDGMSQDGTREIVEEYANRYSCIRLLDNPKRITPAALNIGIAHSSGEVIIRMDAHAEYQPDFVSQSVDWLRRTGADVVGGPIITKPGTKTLMAKAIALATSHPFGVGNSRFRTSKREGFVDTVPFGAYRREVFNQVGLFDERLVRNQDNELSARILRSGRKIYQTPRLTASYYNQATLLGLLKQATRTGMWNILTIKITPSAFRLRHFVPSVFVATLLALGVLAISYPWARFAFLALTGSYLSLAAICSLHIGLKGGGKNASILPVVFFLYHAAYGVGNLVGLVRMALARWRGLTKPWRGQ